MRFLAIAALVFVANCGAAPPDSSPDVTPPPEVSTEGAVVIETRATVPMDVPTIRDFLERNPIIAFMEPTDGLAPPVDVIERILENEPERFSYQIWVFTNSVGRAVEQIVGVQTFTPVAEGQTDFEWSYAIKPKNRLARFLVNRRQEAFEQFLGGATERMAEAAMAEVNGL